MLAILNLRLRQGSLVVNAPVDRSRSLVNKVAFSEGAKQPRGFGFIAVRHGLVGIVPKAENAQAFEVARLTLQRVGGVFTAGAPD